jgi:hypothetical protein
VAAHAAFARAEKGSEPRVTPTRRAERDSFLFKAGAFLFYGTTAALLFEGWRVRGDRLISPEFGLGYALGIAGSTMMLLLLLYPLRKRVRAMRTWGRVSAWFRVHMALGIVGPTLVVFHSNFELGSINSRVALFSMLIVAVSGLFGRYFYSRVHYGLSGRHATLSSLREDFLSLDASGSALAKLLPETVAELRTVEDPLLVPHIGVGEAFVAAIRASVLTRTAALRARRRLAQALADNVSPILERERERLQRNARRYIATRMRALRKYAQFSLFERLLSLWHVVHYPLFLALVVSAIVHVVAVHLY